MSNLARRSARPVQTSVGAAATLALALVSPFAGAKAGSPSSHADPSAPQATGANAVAALPMRFEVNRGQADARARFVARGGTYTAFLTDDGPVVSVRDSRPAPRVGEPLAKDEPVRADAAKARVVRLGLAGASSDMRVTGEGGAAASNYLLGSDRAAWRTDVATYTRVRYANAYPGVDVVFHGDASELACTLEVAPGADLAAVRLRYEGTSATVNGDGALSLEGFEGRTMTASATQAGSANKSSVKTRFAGGGSEVTIDAGDYDRSKTLTVEVPALAVAFLGGGAGVDYAADTAVDASGAIYVAGATFSTDFPTTAGVLDTSINYGELFVTKIAPDGASLVYSTFLGVPVYPNSSTLSNIDSIAVDGAGEVVLAGIVDSSAALPITPGAFDATQNGGNDAFVMKLNATGTALVYATYLGGSGNDRPYDVAADAAGAAYVVGEVGGGSGFPATDGAFQTQSFGTSSAFVTKLSPDGTSLAYSTFLGGSQDDRAYAVKVDGSGRAVVVGQTSSSDFPTTPGVVQPAAGSGAFVSRLSASGAALDASSFLGGQSGAYALDVAVDGAGAVYVAGTAGSGFPTTPGAYDTTLGGSSDAFVAKLTPGLTSYAYATYFGGEGFESPVDVAVDASGGVVLAGVGDTVPTTPGALDATPNSAQPGFVAKLTTDGTALVFSTYLEATVGGVPLDVAALADGSVVVGAEAYSTDFPTTHSLPAIAGDDVDAAVVRLNATGTGLVFGTRLGGVHSRTPATDSAEAMAVDASGNVYLAGVTHSTGFPTTAGVVEVDYNGGTDLFVAKLSSDLSSLVYSTYLGGGDSDFNPRVALDATGRVTVAGVTSSSDFPTTPGAFDTTPGFGFVTRLSADGASLVYSTFLDGAGVNAIAVDAAGAAYLAGSSGGGLPTTPGAYDTTPSGTDAFVTKLNPTGTALVYSTYVGDASFEGDGASAVAVDASGRAVIAGGTGSTTFPTTPGAFQTALKGYSDGFVTMLDATGSSLVFSTYLGGSARDGADAVAVDASGAVFVAGATDYAYTAPFPTTAGGYDTTQNGAYDAFVTKLDPTGTSLVYSTLLGSYDFDSVAGLSVDATGSAYVAGTTGYSSLPTTPGAFDDDPLHPGFVARLTPDGSALLYSSRIDGQPEAVALIDGGVAVAGQTESATFAQDGFGLNDGASAFVAKLATTGFVGDGADTVGVYVRGSGAWFLRDANSSGGADHVFAYGAAGSTAVVLTGDWDGDGVDTPSLYQPSTGAFFLKNANAGGGADIVFTFGAPNAGFTPVVGDWDGDGVDTVGLYAPATSAFFLRNANASGGADVTFVYGPAGAGWKPIAGDWNNDGVDTVGLYAPGTGTFFLTNVNGSGPAALAFGYGPTNLVPLAGDWNGDGVDTVGLYDAGTGAFFLKNANGPGAADALFAYGAAGLEPLAGDWNGQ